MKSHPIARTPDAWAAEVARLQAENAKLTQPVESLTALVHQYEAQFRLSRARTFGPSQEHSDLVQLRLFKEAEQTASATPENAEPATATVTVARKKKTPGQRAAALDHLPVARIEYTLPAAEQVCDGCGGALHAMSTETRRELHVEPPKVSVREPVRTVYACRHCERHGLATPVTTAPMPRPVHPGRLVSATLLELFALC